MSQAARSREFEHTGSPTRQRILAVAQQLFASHGYEGTTVKAIASRLDLTDPALYYHFRSKRQIFEALLDAPLPTPVVLADAAASREELIERMLRTFTAFTQQPDMLRMLFRQQYAGDRASQQHRRDATAAFRATLAEPFARLYGVEGPNILEALSAITAGIIWDAILTYGPSFAHVSDEPWFTRRIRRLFELAMPPVTP